jgi:nicotinamidase-related amidase
MPDPSVPDTSTWPLLGASDRNGYRTSETMLDMRRRARAPRSMQLRAQPQDLLVDLSRTALLVIDMQNDFCAPDGWMASMGANVAPARALTGPINRVTSALRDADVPVIWVNWGVRPDRLNLFPSIQHPFNPTGRGPGLGGEVTGSGPRHRLLQKDSWGAAIWGDLIQDSRDIHVDKHRISGFWDTPLESILRNLDITTTVFAGINADHCVLGTLMDANFHGFDTILLEDCTATTSPEFCLQATLHNVRFCFGFTVVSDDLIRATGGR